MEATCTVQVNSDEESVFGVTFNHHRTDDRLLQMWIGRRCVDFRGSDETVAGPPNHASACAWLPQLMTRTSVPGTVSRIRRTSASS